MPEPGFPVITVRADWTRSYDPWLTVARGAPLRVGRRDSDWPGWVWCDPDEGGAGGWLPERLIDPAGAPEGSLAQARDIYQTRELTVRAGDRLEVLTSDGGWLLCRTAGGEIGWVPSAHTAAD